MNETGVRGRKRAEKPLLSLWQLFFNKVLFTLNIWAEFGIIIIAIEMAGI
jgi:hypothetical protein